MGQALGYEDEQARVFVLKDLSTGETNSKRCVLAGCACSQEMGSNWLLSLFSRLSLSPALPIPF